MSPRYYTAGDGAWVVEFGRQIDDRLNADVHRLDHQLRVAVPPGVVDLVPAYASLTAHFDPRLVSASVVEAWLRDAVATTTIQSKRQAGPEVVADDETGRTLEIPVWYGGAAGPDLADVAHHCGLDEGEVITQHAAAVYRVHMLGFTPGFPYLGGMPAQLATPRLTTPRVRVPAGSVGIAGAQTGIYPNESPGGWRLIGRTPVTLFDPHRDPPCVIEAGDRVRFVAICEEAFYRRGVWSTGVNAACATGVEQTVPVLTVLAPGVLTTVQDLGRFGHQRYGVPVSGAMDTNALRLANLTLGNPAEMACLEVTLSGAAFQFRGDHVVALGGADLRARLNGAPCHVGHALTVSPGDVMRFDGPGRGVRAYLARRGGFAVPLVLGSRATYAPAGLGGVDGRALREGDVLRGAAVPLAPNQMLLARPWHLTNRHAVVTDVRVVRGPQFEDFPDETVRMFGEAVYRVNPQSDRVGCRLDGPCLTHGRSPDMVSDATVMGAVQVPGDGQPVVLMADRGTTGGYPKLAVVITADLWRIAQAEAGDTIRFVWVDAPAAEAARLAQDADLTRASAWPDHAAVPHEPVYDVSAAAPWEAAAARPLATALGLAPPVVGQTGAGVRAGMAGVVIDVRTSVGHVVAAGDILLVVEAMKMEIPLRAPRAGRVVHVAACGTSLSPETIVAELED